jgi:hypothetical protein
MQSRTALIGTVLFTVGFIAVSPRRALNPGPLTAGHEEFSNQCLTCHTPYLGAPAAKCVLCHPLDSIGLQRRQTTAAAEPRPVLAGMHRSFVRTDCLECHTDHAGPDLRGATRAFSHEALSSDFLQRCTGCHEGNRPADSLHAQATAECSACHGTGAWKPTTFRHEALSAGSLQRCSGCHESKRPRDTLHQQGGGECGACHVTRAWTPASFTHGDFFVLDGNHQARCVTCHTEPSNYRVYTCYGCHEHSEARIASKHREEGIGNFGDCVRCHRSGSEHEGGEGRRGGEGGGEHDD